MHNSYITYIVGMLCLDVLTCDVSSVAFLAVHIHSALGVYSTYSMAVAHCMAYEALIWGCPHLGLHPLGSVLTAMLYSHV